MAETKQYAFASPELHWLNNYLGSSHAFKWNANQDVAHGNTSKSSPHMPQGRSSNGKGRDIERELVVSISSGTYSIAATTALAPIKRVYILMQCQNEMIKAGRLSTPYKGMKDCFLRTIKHEGVRSLWRGNSVAVIAVCVGKAFPYLYYDLPCRSYIYNKTKESPLWSLPFIVMPLMLSQYPLDYARVRLATDVKTDRKSMFSLDFSRNNFRKRQFNGAIDVYKKTLRLDGIHGLYRGFSASCIGLFAYDMTKSFNPTSSKETHNQKKATIPAWMVNGCIYQSLNIVLYPFETVSQRMMMTSGETSKYRGVMNAFHQIVKTEGVSSLFKGVTPYVLHSIAFSVAYAGIASMTLSALQTLAEG